MARVLAAAAVRLAEAFGVATERVEEDAEALAGWNRPWDDLLVYLRRRYPSWKVGKATTYVLLLRDALKTQEPPTT